MSAIKIALSKGRILDETLPLLAHAGITPTEDPKTSRKLILDTSTPDVQLVVVRATDVPTFVQFGAADLGVVGKDLLLETNGAGVYELVDLKISPCRMVVAEPKQLAGDDDPSRWTRLRIATKYPEITRTYFAGKGIQTDIIKLYGSMELAPLAGLSDRIVDLVGTGQTLRENGLVEMETIAHVTARLVANKAAMKLKQPRLRDIVSRVQEAVAS